jgi:hypothetical protein
VTNRSKFVVALLLAQFAPLLAFAQGKPVITKNARNTFTFNHLALRGATDAPFVLEIGDGEFFQVLITNTDPRLFRYSIAATADEEGPLTSSFEPGANGIPARHDSWASVTQRHDKHFNRYRVTISPVAAQAGATVATRQAANSKLRTLGMEPRFDETEKTVAPLLYPVAFDLWVSTRPEWKVSFSGGVAFSGLTDHKFFIKTTDAKKTVEEDTAARDRTRHDVIALANVYFDHQYGRGLMFGAAFGVGDNGGSTPRYFVGPSVVLGRNFIFTAGTTFGSIATLPVGQLLHDAPINGDNTLNNLGSRYQHGFFAALAFTFIDKETEFRNGFTSSTTTGAESAAPSAATANDLTGEYKTVDNKIEKVEIADVKGKTAMTLTLDAETAAKFATELGNKSAITLEKKTDVTFENGDDRATFAISGDTTTLEFKHGTTTIVSASKKKSSA